MSEQQIVTTVTNVSISPKSGILRLDLPKGIERYAKPKQVKEGQPVTYTYIESGTPVTREDIAQLRADFRRDGAYHADALVAHQAFPEDVPAPTPDIIAAIQVERKKAAAEAGPAPYRRPVSKNGRR